MSEKLTQEQKDMIMSAMWVVNTILKKYELSTDDDMRQNAILYLCKCARRFDTSKEVQWTTYAYRNLYFFVRRTYARQKLVEGRYIAQGEVGENIVDTADVDEQVSAQMTLEKIYNILTQRERAVFILAYKGLNFTEIGKELNITAERTRQIWKRIKYKARQFKGEQDNV